MGADQDTIRDQGAKVTLQGLSSEEKMGSEPKEDAGSFAGEKDAGF